jgi:hypothetical protein
MKFASSMRVFRVRYATELVDLRFARINTRVGA